MIGFTAVNEDAARNQSLQSHPEDFPNIGCRRWESAISPVVDEASCFSYEAKILT
jgi:hypothetical protein